MHVIRSNTCNIFPMIFNTNSSARNRRWKRFNFLVNYGKLNIPFFFRFRNFYSYELSLRVQLSYLCNMRFYLPQLPVSSWYFRRQKESSQNIHIPYRTACLYPCRIIYHSVVVCFVHDILKLMYWIRARLSFSVCLTLYPTSGWKVIKQIAICVRASLRA